MGRYFQTPREQLALRESYSADLQRIQKQLGVATKALTLLEEFGSAQSDADVTGLCGMLRDQIFEQRKHAAFLTHAISRFDERLAQHDFSDASRGECLCAHCVAFQEKWK